MLRQKRQCDVAREPASALVTKGVAQPRLAAARLAQFLCLIALVPVAARAARPALSRVLRAEGKGYLEQVGDQFVLHVAGTPYKMGWQHGRLLRKKVAAKIRKLAKHEMRLRGLRSRRRLLRESLPKAILDELHGLADGAGVRREEIELLQVHFLRVFESRGRGHSAAAWGSATIEGKLYHAHSLELPRSGPAAPELHGAHLLVVARPGDGLPYAYPAWAGFVGALAGMNAEAISVGATFSRSRDESGRGLTMPFVLKEILRRGRSLDDALRLFRETPRRRGYNAIISEGKIPAAVVVEATPSLCHVMRPADRATDRPPHLAIPDCVRRTNHFVHPASAARERKTYHPVHQAGDSWLRYWSLSQFLTHYRGRLDAGRMIGLLRDRPPGASPCRQVLFSTTDRVIWLAEPRNPLKDGNQGARGPGFVRYPLPDLLADQRIALVTDVPPAKRRPPTFGLCACTDTLKPLSDPGPKANALLAVYNFPPVPFPWRMRVVKEAERYAIHRLTFPSPRRSEMLENNTVHAEYYVPRPAVKRAPAAVVLHILDGRFILARLICRTFAANGVPSLMVQMPYYGCRRPRGMSLSATFIRDPRRLLDAVQGTVLDVRRAACWLQKRPEVDPSRIGIVGVSLGAISAALVAGVDRRFNRNVLVLGGGDPAGILWHAPETRGVRDRLVQLGYTLEKLRKEARAVDAIHFAKRVNPREVLMINARYDKTVPRESTLALWKAMGKPTIHWQPAGHYSASLFIPIILPTALSFVRDSPSDSAIK